MPMNIERSVRERYSEGARERQAALCCPVSYDAGLLAMLPDEIIEKDYGCGDPSRYVREGDTVLDLGSGGGKVCYMAAQLVGAGGRVIGVDINDDMLALARRHQAFMARQLGGDRVSFRKGHIQDLALDHEALDAYLAANPVSSGADYAALKAWKAAQRSDHPLVDDLSVDLVISNCVLNLVADREKQQLADEIYRVLKPGGRVALADIISDRPVPAAMKNDPALWSGCIAGAFQEAEFLEVFARAGFHCVCYDKWEPRPWQVVEGIEFRAVTLTAIKPADDAVRTGDAVIIYRGPFAEVMDDTGNRYLRGQRIRVSRETHELLMNPAYAEAFIDATAAPPNPAPRGGPAEDALPPAQLTDSGHDGCCS